MASGPSLGVPSFAEYAVWRTSLSQLPFWRTFPSGLETQPVDLDKYQGFPFFPFFPFYIFYIFYIVSNHRIP